MNKYFNVSILLLIFLCCMTPIGFAQSVDLVTCFDDQLNIKFLCNENWELESDHESMLIIIERDPAVTMTITKLGNEVKFLNQLSKSKLKETGQYADGFVTEMVEFNGLEAIKVKAFSEKYSDIRLVDYYFLKDGELYAILFSVSPKERWSEYQFLIDRIIQSFRFVS